MNLSNGAAIGFGPCNTVDFLIYSENVFNEGLYMQELWFLLPMVILVAGSLFIITRANHDD